MAAELPSESIYDILSRLPVKSLARFRCVSKLWCNYINDPYLETMHAKRAVINDPILLTFHQISPDHHPYNSPCTLGFIEYKEEEEASSCTLEMRKKPKPPAMEFIFNIKDYRKPGNRIIGSCNGLLYLSSLNMTFIVIHPLMRECYELPPIITPQLLRRKLALAYPYNRRFLERSSGLGFDDSTNTFKMVCVIMPTENFQCTMVHVLGTDSWRKIPQVPASFVTGEGVFVNGCLHWLPKDDYDWPIITFEIKTEEFGLIKPPIEIPCGHWMNVHLVDLHGQLGFVYTFLKNSSYFVEVWVLKKRGWVMHCRFGKKPYIFSFCDLKVLGCWNKNGDILVMNKTNKGLYVYNLKGDSLYEVSSVGLEQGREKDIRMYQSSLFATRYSIREKR